MAYGFQSSAFQNSGFQSNTIVTPTTSIGGGYEDDKKKKRYVVRKGGQLLVFTNEADAIAYVSHEPSKAKQYPAQKKGKAKVVAEPIVVPAPTPVEQINLQEIVDLSIYYAAQQEYQFLLKAQEYEALLNLYRKFKQREEEELIVLLLAA